MTKASDTQVREQALNVDCSFIVKAPAGSGKTTLLVKRYLKLLATINSPEEIIAITFTRKAAGEMVNRVLNALNEAKQYKNNEPDDQLIQLAKSALRQDKRMNWSLLENPARLRIMTIDSFANRLVRQMPWSAGFGAAPHALADDVHVYYESAARETIFTALADKYYKAIIEQLMLVFDNDFQRVSALIVSMLARRDQWQSLLIGKLSHCDARSELEKNWQQIVNYYLNNCSEKIPDSIKTDLLDCARHAAKNMSMRDSDSPICYLNDIDTFPQASIKHLYLWKGLAALLLTNAKQLRKRVDINAGFPPGKDGDNQIIKDKFKSVLDSIAQYNADTDFATIAGLPETAYTDKEWQLLVSLVDILKLSVAQLSVIFQQHGLCDHIEMATRANLSLGSLDQPSDLSLRLDYQISHLMIDEFQDTSHTQIQMFRLLTAGWQSGDGRTVFLVGDPMQSIYRFRQADVGIFLNIYKNGFENIELTPLELKDNFRSSSVLVDWVNNAFKHVFPDKDNYQTSAVKYSASKAFIKTVSDHDRVKIHPTTRQDEATQIADLIAVLLDKNDDEHKIAVLARSRSHLNEIVSELQSRQIAYHGLKLEPLSQQSCILDIRALTLAISHLGDRLSWLAILRAPWCGLSLADLTHIANHAADKTIWQVITKPPEALSASAIKRLSRFVKVMNPILNKAGKIELHFLVANAWQSLGGADITSPIEQLNIKTYLDLLSEIQTAGTIPDLVYFNQAIEQLWAACGTASASILLMTMHMAKGLEFDTVILPGLFKKPKADEAKALIWNEFSASNASPILLVSPIKIRHHDPLRYDFIRNLDQKVQIEESKRLFYVACTRAKQQLHLFVSAKPDSQSLQQTMPSLTQAVDTRTNFNDQFEQNNVSDQATSYKRLPLNYTLPEIENRTVQLDSRESTDSVIEYQWAGIAAIHIGTLIHEAIYKLAINEQNPVIDNSHYWKNKLLYLGVGGHELDEGVNKIAQAIKTMREHDIAKWILNNTHQQQKNEWALTSQTDFKLENLIIDRTFIDKHGVRWIIDYKTSTHEGGNIEGFVDNEKKRYQSQLEHYAAALRKIETNPIKLGLYFPLLKAWREWQYGS